MGIDPKPLACQRDGFVYDNFGERLISSHNPSTVQDPDDSHGEKIDSSHNLSTVQDSDDYPCRASEQGLDCCNDVPVFNPYSQRWMAWTARFVGVET